MQQFQYRARRTPQELEEGLLEAESEQAAARTLIHRGLFPIDVIPFHRSAHYSLWSRIKHPGLGLTGAELGEICRQLGDLLLAGESILEGIDVLRQQMRGDRVSHFLEALAHRIRAGIPLSEALSQHSFVPRSIVGAVQAGEAAGALGEVLHRVGEMLEQEQDLRKKLQEAIQYPAIVLVAAIGTGAVIFGYLIPRLGLLYKDLGQALPWSTRVVLAVGNTVASYGWLIVIALGSAILVAIWQWRKDKAFRLRVDHLLLMVPFLGKILLGREHVRFARSLATLVAGGVPVLQALELTKEGLRNGAIRGEVGELYEHVRQGGAMATALANTPNLGGALVSLVRIGEETGDLSGALERAAILSERQLNGRIKRLTTWLEPLLIMGLGLLVAFLVFSMMLPILQLDLQAM